eukprot:gb/GEZN01015874.1/.p1 GENE.gb/GEZN01015874.1/~~gb/GEZN01015874.1/.p1  ORF type:complete len:258 (-),score=16.71 gb/GEZN01015874.1/:55-828(-)
MSNTRVHLYLARLKSAASSFVEVVGGALPDSRDSDRLAEPKMPLTLPVTPTAGRIAPTPEGKTVVKKSTLYTKSGDTGMTVLFNMDRKAKTEDYFDALGDVDELNAHIGLAREHIGKEGENGVTLCARLAEIQCQLFDVCSHIATPLSSSTPAQLERCDFVSDGALERLERWIDEYDARLPRLKNFIIPSGGLASCQLHVARTVARRAERHTAPLVIRGDAKVDVLKYLNRVSDFLFVAARFACSLVNAEEIPYRKP